MLLNRRLLIVHAFVKAWSVAAEMAEFNLSTICPSSFCNTCSSIICAGDAMESDCLEICQMMERVCAISGVTSWTHLLQPIKRVCQHRYGALCCSFRFKSSCSLTETNAIWTLLPHQCRISNQCAEDEASEFRGGWNNELMSAESLLSLQE